MKFHKCLKNKNTEYESTLKDDNLDEIGCILNISSGLYIILRRLRKNAYDSISVWILRWQIINNNNVRFSPYEDEMITSVRIDNEVPRG